MGVPREVWEEAMRSRGKLLDGSPLPKFEVTSCGVELEASLHAEIEQDCRSRGFYYVHSRMDRQTTCGVGTPDFVIALPGGKTFWVEAKARREKPKPDQLAAAAHLRKLGHHIAVVRNREEWLLELGYALNEP